MKKTVIVNIYNFIRMSHAEPSEFVIDDFETIQNQLIPNGNYTMTRKIKEFNINVKALMNVDNSKFILKKGSKIAPYKSYHTPSWITTRSEMKIDAEGILLEDVECSSPSMAAALVVGQAANGWKSWKNKNNKSIDEYKKV